MILSVASKGTVFADTCTVKRYFLVTAVLAATICLFSCNRKKETSSSTTESESSTTTAKKVTKRNFAINKQNSYSDFFFDSSKLAAFISDNKFPDSLSSRLISFYNSRNYQFAWFSSKGMTEQGRGFWNMYKYYLSFETDKVDNDSAFTKQMDRIVVNDRDDWEGTQEKMTDVELNLTAHFLQFYFSNVAKGYLKRKEIERMIPSQRSNAFEIADSLVNKKHKDDKYYGDINKTYGGLNAHLTKYVDVYKKGGWPVITAKASSFKEGASGANVALLKQRLWLSGDLEAADTTAIWSPALTTAINKVQRKHGYKQTGIITDALLKDINVPVEKRIAQLLVNMGRAQWIIDQPSGKFILVNIPEFLMHVSDQGKKVFDMAVVVGKEGHNTTIFTGKLNQVVFSPYWNVPESIVKKEIVPSMEKDPNYLEKQNMEVNGSLPGGLPAVRQLPGEKNSLGLVKFLFPNSYDIYFHDTPAKSLFAKDKRAYSHGCIRLSEPAKLAEWLLQDHSTWTPDKIQEAMHAGSEQFVRIKNPVPVLITYYTAWIEPDGTLRFAEDIYGHDAALMSRMFDNF